MIELDLGKNRKVRVWLNESAGAEYKSPVSESYSLSASNRNVSCKTITAEAISRVGPRTLYGLLGFEMVPENKSSLTLLIPVLESPVRSFSSPLVNNYDRLHVGFLREFVDGIKKGVTQAALEIDPLASGQILVKEAAVADIGSCEVIFKALTIFILKIMHGPKDSLTADKIAALFPKRF